MGLFSRAMGPDINAGVRDFEQQPDGLLVDARTPEEYISGHIPGSINIPLSTIQHSAGRIGTKDRPVYLYCQSGARSQQATNILHQMGYKNARNIGGIMSWRGKVVTG